MRLARTVKCYDLHPLKCLPVYLELILKTAGAYFAANKPLHFSRALEGY